MINNPKSWELFLKKSPFLCNFANDFCENEQMY